VNSLGEFEGVTEYWSAQIVGQINDQYAKIVKARGASVSQA